MIIAMLLLSIAGIYYLRGAVAANNAVQAQTQAFESALVLARQRHELRKQQRAANRAKNDASGETK